MREFLYWLRKQWTQSSSVHTCTPSAHLLKNTICRKGKHFHVLWWASHAWCAPEWNQTVHRLPIHLHCIWYHLLCLQNSCVNWRAGKGGQQGFRLGFEGEHTQERKETSRARQSSCSCDTGHQASLCYPHGKQRQSTLICGMHERTQWEPALESPKTEGKEHSPAWPK